MEQLSENISSLRETSTFCVSTPVCINHSIVHEAEATLLFPYNVWYEGTTIRDWGLASLDKEADALSHNRSSSSIGTPKKSFYTSGGDL